ncbi:hypothetical protein GQX73_g6804 [Xylaria multiplex]|uniref:Uncharacterized protein n=1 Tax=Xylaria multiplex TaxID=323545 RepID=A0A7C8IYL8_9PEZI|nr:hypothetical protein GQX73_g6804 [Xylaria multiplex]
MDPPMNLFQEVIEKLAEKKRQFDQIVQNWTAWGSPEITAIVNGFNESLTLTRSALDRSTDEYENEKIKNLVEALEHMYSEAQEVLRCRREIEQATAECNGAREQTNGSPQPNPPLLAARDKHLGVAKLLSARLDVQPNIQDSYGNTALFWASSDWSTELGDTPLANAAFKGHEETVRLFVQQNDVRPRFGDGEYCPLWCAISKRHARILRLFLKQYDINPGHRSLHGKSLTWWASRLGQADVADLLLGRDDVNPSLSDHDTFTPLFEVATRGHDEVVQLLLNHSMTCPSLYAVEDWTPLFVPANERYSTIVEHILRRVDIDPNVSNRKD